MKGLLREIVQITKKKNIVIFPGNVYYTKKLTKGGREVTKLTSRTYFLNKFIEGKVKLELAFLKVRGGGVRGGGSKAAGESTNLDRTPDYLHDQVGNVEMDF